MSKRTIWQCDRCSQQIEADDMPSYWVFGVVATGPSMKANKIWCPACWRDISIPLPLPEQPK